MRKSPKVVASVLSVAALGVVALAGCAAGSDKPASKGQSSSSGASDANISVQRGSCEHQLSNSRIIFSVTLRNSGGTAGTVDVGVVRDYADATSNDSVMDTLIDVKVKAHSTRSVWNEYHVDPQIGHTLEACAARIDGNDTPLAASVVY